ncbi:MAG TPA: M1 family metallopeptidase, partial [Balneolaceae bacterium]|nr:M1 family metallopeptidase [Balneolaceae bacterium]
MNKIRFLTFELLIFFFVAGSAWAQQTQSTHKNRYNSNKVFDPTFMNGPGTAYRSGDGTPGPKYWTNRVNYTIHTKLNPQDTTITGKVTIHYTNNSPDSLHYLWLQLDQNLFSPHSIAHATMPPGGDRFAKAGNKEFNGGETVHAVSVKLRGQHYSPKYVISDTRMQIRLRKPVKPHGGKVQVSMNFKFKIPIYGSDRMGRLKTAQGWIYQIAQWYPRMEVYDDIRGWNTLPYIGLGEFYEDYGNFNYYVTVPWNMIVAGSGVLQDPDKVLTKKEQRRYKKAQKSNSTVRIIKPSEVGKKDMRPVHHGNLTWHFKMKNSRDVSWAASQAFIWDGAKVNLPSGRKALAMAMYPKESMGKHDWQHATHMLKRSIEIYSKKFYEFPWKRATTVAGITHGMEYPGIVFCYYNTRSPQDLWSVTTHEIGHNWFPMIVGTNERRNEWMDEGVNTFIDGIGSHIYKNGKFNYNDGSPLRIAEIMKRNPHPQPLDTRPDAMRMSSYGLYYTKTSLGLKILRNFVVGKKLFDYAFRSYIRQWAYKHPRPKDFFRRMNDATGEDLNWFWKEWFYKNWKLDQAVTNVKYVNQNPSKGAYITLKNKDMMVFPVLVKVWQSNGKTGTKKLPVQIWQRGGTWTFKYNSTSRIDSVKIDPNMQLPDVDRSNNVWRAPSTNS